jgi:hypothetical protein
MHELVIENEWNDDIVNVTTRFPTARKKSWRRACVGIPGMIAAMLSASNVYAQDTPELSQLAQNPIAKAISLPFQNNLNFGVGPHSDNQDTLNIQPVLPFNVGNDWNVIARAIIPLEYEPPLGETTNSMVGLGDTSLALYLSPSHPGEIIWGVGPAFAFATASHEELGQGKFDAGLSAVVLTIQGHWLIGALLTDVASVAGPSDRNTVHQMTLQPFINYNFPRGWYLASSPIITANWRGPSNQRWIVPLGGGGGRAFRFGKQAMNFQLQVFKNVVSPHDAADWTLRAQFQLLFPK